MTIKDLKEYFLTLPKEFDDYSVINREFGTIDDTSNYYFLDKPIVSCSVDEEHKELFLMDNENYDKYIELDK